MKFKFTTRHKLIGILLAIDVIFFGIGLLLKNISYNYSSIFIVISFIISIIIILQIRTAIVKYILYKE